MALNIIFNEYTVILLITTKIATNSVIVNSVYRINGNNKLTALIIYIYIKGNNVNRKLLVRNRRLLLLAYSGARPQYISSNDLFSRRTKINLPHILVVSYKMFG